jgi:hypothetical protein
VGFYEGIPGENFNDLDKSGQGCIESFWVSSLGQTRTKPNKGPMEFALSNTLNRQHRLSLLILTHIVGQGAQEAKNQVT